MNFKLDSPMWQHHRTGWKHVYPELAKLTVQYHVIFNGHLDVYFSEGKHFTEPWIGFLHNVPDHFDLTGRYKRFFSLDKTLNTEQWKISEKWCKGIYVLSPYLYNYLKEKISLPLECLYLPSKIDCDLFSFNKFIENKKNLIMIGSWLRKTESIFEIDMKIENQIVWSHHRSGWKDVISAIFDKAKIKNVYFEGWLEGIFSFNKSIQKPWVGFFHCTPEHPNFGKYCKIKSLSEIIKSDAWKKSEPYCKGIFVLSDYLESYLRKFNFNFPIVSLKHPVSECEIKFDFDYFKHNKKIVMVGQWLRKFESMYYLDVSYNKCLLKTGHSSEKEDLNILMKKVGSKYNEVQILERKTDAEYDKLLQSSIVFLDLYDVAANNTILDCIVRNTPVLVNKLSGAVDYLGDDYPFYFYNLEDAAKKAQDLDLIFRTNLYLQSLPIKNKLTIEYFIESFKNSSIYKKLNKKLFI